MANLGPYVLGERLGAGGMGVVHRARDERLARDVAIKLLPPEFRVPDRLARFVTEARAAAALSHPNVLAVFDVSIDGEQPYLVTELLEGQPLDALLAAGPLPPRRALELAGQIARGLAAAHERGIAHRDLKPSNLFLTRDGTVKILDFGLAKVIGAQPTPFGDTFVPQNAEPSAPRTAEGAILGTLGYMAPEQLEGRTVDARCDLFSFGCVLHELLTGTRPFGSGSPMEVATRILRDEPDPLPATVPAQVARIVARCLEKDPARRFQSARDLGFALEMAEASSSVGAATPAVVAGTPSSSSPGSCARTVALTGGAVALAAAVALLSWRGHSRPADGEGASVGPPAATVPHFTQITHRPGWVGAAQFAPGGSVVFASYQNDVPQVFSATPGSAEVRALSPPGSYFEALSPTGELALQVAGPDGHETLARAELSGGAPRAIADHVQTAAWGPDGKLLVAREVGGKLRIEYPLGHTLYETDAPKVTARVSPKGDQIALEEFPLPSYAHGTLEVLTLDGKVRALTRLLPSLGPAVWTPDGKELWFSFADGKEETRTVSAVTLDGRQRKLFEESEEVVLRDIGPDGRVLLATQQFHHRISGQLPGMEHESDLSWFELSDAPVLSADGKHLLSTVFGGGAGPQVGNQNAIYLREGPSTPAVQLGSGNALALSPDGRWALVGGGDLLSDLELVPTGVGTSRKLISKPLHLVTAASFFPDGQRVLLVGQEQGKGFRTWVLDLNGGALRPLTAEGVLTACPPSPDGRWIAAFGPDHRASLLPVEGGPPKPLEGVPDGYLPIGWTEGGKGLFLRRLGEVLRFDGYVSTAAPVAIERYELATHRRTPWRTIVPGEPAGMTHIDAVVITPDGKSYAYAYAARSGTLFAVDGLK